MMNDDQQDEESAARLWDVPLVALDVELPEDIFVR